jgi:ADP-ribose pyrophosphatase
MLNANSDKMKPLETEKVVFQGKIHEVLQQEVKTGEIVQTFETVRRAPGTRLIIVSKDGKILITKEYRFEHDKYDYRLPGGKVFNKLQGYHEFLDSGKDMEAQAMEAAKLEAREEAGIEVRGIRLYKISHCGATIQWDLFYYIVENFEIRKEGQKLGHGEDIKVAWFTKDEVKKMCLEGAINEDRSVAVLFQYLSGN